MINIIRLVEMDISGSGITYKPGDIALVLPQNLQQNIEDFFALFPNLGKSWYQICALYRLHYDIIVSKFMC